MTTSAPEFIDHDLLLIGSEWRRPSTDAVLEVISPVTEEVVGRVPIAGPEDIDAAVDAARQAFDSGRWSRLTAAERAASLRGFLAILDAQRDHVVDVQITEMGGTRRWLDSSTGYGFTAIADLYESVAAQLPLLEVRSPGGVGGYTLQRDPIGVVAILVPWNAPIGQVMSKLIPALIAGCTAIVKVASLSPLSATLIGKAVTQAGLPAGVLSVLTGNSSTGELLVSHPGIDLVSFTGSPSVGAHVGGIASRNLIPSVLELGGKSAAIVRDDADLDTYIASLVGNAIPNTGQVCYSTTRILASDARYDDVLDRLTSFIGNQKFGDPYEIDTDYGPLVSKSARERVEGYIRTGIADGARIALGGGRAQFERGYYVEPTVFADVDNRSTIAQEEIFGPVLSVIRYTNDDDAVRIANESDFGLGGAIFTSDVEGGIELAQRIRTGTLQINDGYPAGAGGPFGGYKRSGFGRENGPEGIDAFFQKKSIALPTDYRPAA